MDKKIAEKTALVAHQSSMLLDAHLKNLQEVLEKEEFSLLCRKFGNAMGEIYFQLLEPIYKEHPDLLPEKMGGPYKTNDSMYKELSKVVSKYASPSS